MENNIVDEETRRSEMNNCTALEAISGCENGLDKEKGPSRIVYVVCMQEGAVTYFDASSPEFFIAKNAVFPEDLKPHSLSCLSFSPSAVFSPLSKTAKHSYLYRYDFAYPSHHYDNTVLRSLLLGMRVMDYQNSAAVVVTVEPFVLRILRRHLHQDTARFITENGILMEVNVDDVVYQSDSHLEILCSPLNPIPSGLVKNSRLLLYNEHSKMSPAQEILEQCFKGRRPIVNRSLLDRIYGRSARYGHPKVADGFVSIRTIDDEEILFSHSASEALRRYQSPASSCPALVFQGPPGSGKTLLAAAMAASYCGVGLQLLLSPSLLALPSLVRALAALGTTNKIVCLEADCEIRGILRGSPMYCEVMPRLDSANGAIVLATVDTILEFMVDQFRPEFSNGSKTNKLSRIRQLIHGVQKIIVDEANQLSEAALNALIQCFPSAPSFAFLGDDSQLLPAGSVKSDLASQLAGVPALKVVRRKLNVPVIAWLVTHRHAMDRQPYSFSFYGSLINFTRNKDRPAGFRLAALSPQIDRNCLLMDAPQWEAIPAAGDSWINDHEINALVCTLKKLEEAGEESIMIIALFEAQRQLALAILPEYYDVLTVEQAQGREADIVILLTTVDKPTTDAAFTCKYRCVVATSRHREALIVFGREELMSTEQPWSRLYVDAFFHVTRCDVEKGIFGRSDDS